MMQKKKFYDIWGAGAIKLFTVVITIAVFCTREFATVQPPPVLMARLSLTERIFLTGHHITGRLLSFRLGSKWLEG